MKVKLIVVLALTIIVSLPSLSMGAEKIHFFDCSECHIANGTLTELAGANVCVRCHDASDPLDTVLNAGSRYNSVGTHTLKPTANFDIGDASHVYGNNPIPNSQTSHHWAVSTTYNAASGSSEPNRSQYPNMYSRYNASTGKVTCSRCHDPHGDATTNPKLLRLSADNLNPMTENELCEACHSDFVSMGAPSYNGLMTHPVMNSTLLNSIILDNPAYDMAGVQNYNSAAPYTNSAVLIEGGVSCSTCHGPHFADSNKSTPDGPALASTGDGLLLRSDGPTSNSAVIYNGVTNRYNTAQLRSNLCQDCHTYKMHGDPAYVAWGGPANPNHNIGCLDCHGGHSYNGGTPSLYVLADKSPDAVPTRLQKAYNGDVQVTYPHVDTVTTRTEWADNVVGTATGFCEVCHGDVNDPAAGGLANSVDQHKITGGDECSNCHTHNDSSYSFKLDASAASCGDCHGFPPYKDIRGDRAAWYDARDGGYAYYNSAGYDYTGRTYFKDETKTAHKTHAGRDLKSAANTAVLGAEGWYFVGTAGIDNCTPCHGPDAGKTAGGHKIDPGTNSDTFRDIDFATPAVANGFGNVAGTQYNADAGDNCSNVYCHSAGAPRTGPTGADGDRNWNAGLTTTPVWVGNGGWPGDGFDSITNTSNTSRCQTCHGNDAASMEPLNTYASHGGHFNSALMNIGTNCNICHANTAMDKDTLTANATDHRPASGGQHVNGVQDVSFNTTILYNALAGETYDPQGDGVCSVYCHNPDDTTYSADWDVAGAMTCNSCHADQLTPGTSTGSHERHLPNVGRGLNGPQLVCANCHGVDSDTGTHVGHIDGLLTQIPPVGAFNSICEECHGFDGEAGEVLPQWGVADSTDCATCHAGTVCGASFVNGGGTNDPDHLRSARLTGHNRPTSAGLYDESDNVPANNDCNSCHLSDSPNHWDGTNYDASGLEADLLLNTANFGGTLNFPANYNTASNMNLFCGNCHGSSPLHPESATAALNIQTHNNKLCVACHNVHGEVDNVQMIWQDYTAQNQHDISPGKYSTANVWFTNTTEANFTGDGDNSYDEDDGDDGATSEDNADDICATCHTAAGGNAAETTLHNNKGGTGSHVPSHNLSTDCFGCHAAHSDPGGAFLPSAGSSCDGCHGYPPTTSAHTLHSVSTNPDGSDDRSDCAYCHGSDVLSYTYTTGEFNHSNATNRRTILNTAVGFGKDTGDKWTCTKACHNSDNTDGYWYTWDDVGQYNTVVASRLPIDTDGLNCDKCHYYSGSPSGAGNVNNGRSEALSAAHSEHFDAGKGCGSCHDIAGVEYNNGSSIPGGANGLAHINYNSVGSDIVFYNGAAFAEQNEAGFDEGGGVRDVLSALNYTDENTCSGATTGCHATGSPDWDNAIPATATGCQQCHTDTTTSAYNPTSGLHNNTATLTVTGNAHDGSFYNGSTLGIPADCVTCHTTSPSSAHADGLLNSATVTINSTVIPTYNSANKTCNTSCHSAGTAWAYKWSTTAYNSDGTQCANCHGSWNDFRDGLTHRGLDYGTDPKPKDTHGTGTLGCRDCHAMESSTGYTYNAVNADWNENDPATTGIAAETSNHGNGLISLNYNGTNFGRNGSGLSGCSTCHNQYDAAAPGSFSFETTSWSLDGAIQGEGVTSSCSQCHGGGHSGTNANSYWPAGTNVQDDSAGAKNNSGAHDKHMFELTKAVYPADSPDYNTAINNLLTDNTANYNSLTSEEKQKELCSYCHVTPVAASDPGHTDSGLPAETLATANDSNTSGQGFYELWEVPRVDRDSTDYDTTGSGSCYVSSCHNTRATDANSTNYGWYADNSSSCETCHDPDKVVLSGNAGGVTHIAHKNSATLYGRGAVCADCHDSATDWTGNTTPDDGFHIDGTFAIQSGVVIDGSTATYTPGTGCGANACHNDGTGAEPVDNTYAWADNLSNCNFCHLDPPATGAHTEHMGSTTYVDCIDCHTPGDDTGNHIRGSVTYNTNTISEYPAAGGAGSCTNTCHIAGDGGDWTGGFTALACADCHSGSYVGGGGNMPTSGLHVTSNITTHDASLQSGNCINCHDGNGPVSAADHGDGTLQNAATITYNFNANVVSYVPADGCMAAIACHTDGGDWSRKWNGVVDEVVTGTSVPGNTVCDNCHGAPTTFDDPSLWRWNEANGSTTDHTDPYAGNDPDNKMDQHGGGGLECKTCHGFGDPAYNVATMHINGSITMNGPANSATGAGYNSVTGGCTKACHTEAFVLNTNSGWTEEYFDFGAGGGACDSCHGDQNGNYYPDGNTVNAAILTADDEPGKHAEHVAVLAAKGYGQPASCAFCHGPEPGTGSYHNDDGVATLPQHSSSYGPAWYYKRIIGNTDDTDGVFNTSGNATSTCSTVDCHFNNAYTPHWYDSDNVAPGAVTQLAAVPGANPYSVEVTYNSPGADAGLVNTTAYRYDVRVSAVSAGDAANYNSATSVKVGGLPASYLKDELTEIVIENLNPGNSYYIAARAQDTELLWGPIATTGPVTPTTDTEPPVFFGVDKALSGDEGGSINLYWTDAEDHSMYTMDPVPTNRLQQPIRYEIWLKSEVRGDLDMTDNTGYNSAILWDTSQTFYTGNAIELEGTYTHTGGGTTLIEDDVTYQLGVRACDYLDNCETNSKTVNVTPKAPNAVPEIVASYVSNVATGFELVRNGPAGGSATTDTLTSSTPIDFYGSSVAYAVDYYVDSFTVSFTDDRTASQVTAQLGVWESGTTCNLGTSTAQVSPAIKTTSFATFKFGATEKLSAGIGESFCIHLTTLNVPAGNTIDINYGGTSRGDASVIEQKANIDPLPIVAPNINFDGAVFNMSWTVPGDDGDGLTSEETPHYDIYGSNNNGSSWDYVISENHDWNDPSVIWDTQADGITSGLLAVKIRPGDGFSHAADVVGETIFDGYGPATALDKVSPSQITDLAALPRPKKGTVELRWTCPGDDYMNNGRADHYEVVYSTAPISDYNSAIPVENTPPYPDFGKHVMAFEVTGLPQETPLYFAAKAFDEQGNSSPMSNVYGPVNSGPSCGMCHTTGPSVVESEGNHKLHGFTLNDCDKCHDDGSDAPSTFGLDHQDGVLKMGYGPGNAVVGSIVDQGAYNSIIYEDPFAGGTKMYEDTSGFGGLGEGNFVQQGDGIDNGSCYNFGAMGVGGCHGPAGSDPDSNSGLSEYPLFETPNWSKTANLDCGRCHGNPNRAETATGYTGGGYKKDPYGRDYDGTIYNSATKPAGVVPDQIIGAPGADNRGGWDSGSASVDERKYIGQHEKHLNYSFRFSKGDSCNLCHDGHYKDVDALDGKHGNGSVDILLDTAAAGVNAHYNAAGAGVAGQCFGMDPFNCHPSNEAPSWDSDASFPCLGCHTMGNDINKIGHYTDPGAGIDDDSVSPGGDPDNTLDGFDSGLPGNCTWCHFAGHPTDDVGGTALILPNNPQVGISYKSGGIHLRKQPGGPSGPHSSYDTQAELCWGCHDSQVAYDVSEWGRDDGPGDVPNNNSAILPANGNVYDFGYVTTSDWTTATWSSNYSSLGNNANAYFEYKTGPIQSTHSTNITNGSSAVTWNATDQQWEESPDAVADLQCHNCHDVHNMNFADGDNMSGNPYLRGSWLSNPYREDGAPRGPGSGNTTYTAELNFGPVPRGGTPYGNIGGYQIDENNGHATGPPTKGWVASTAGGLCLLCHGANGVDGLDQETGEDLWITAGKNGHSNSALGGTADDLLVTDIFSFNDRNNTDPVMYDADYGGVSSSGNPAMGYVNVQGMDSVGTTTDYRGDGFRSNWGFGWVVNADSLANFSGVENTADYAYNNFNWGVTQDSTGTVNKGYHAFSCSKCHNPHASRLPKLMITNCLDTKQNTWDDQWSGLTGNSNQGSTLDSANLNKTLSNVTSAQNCHRLGDPGQSGTGSGWNLVTPRKVMP